MEKKLKLRKVVRKGRFGDELYVGSNREPGYTAYFRDFPEIVAQSGGTVKEAQTRLWNTAYDVFKYLLSAEKMNGKSEKNETKEE